MNKTRQTTWNSAHVGQASRLPVQGASLPRDRVAKSAAASCLLAVALGSSAASTDQDASARFRKEVQPLLVEYCYDCHGEGMSKGNLAFDSFKSDQELLARRDLWWAVLKNVRAGLMPPAKKPRP